MVVKAGYRLHLGFYRFSDEPLIYGSLGAALKEPQLTLSIRPSEGVSVKTPTRESREIIEKVVRSLRISDVDIELRGFVEHHVGLGSTTRIVLATLTALATLRNPELDVVEWAFKLGRGKISSIGVYTFIYGNLVVDSGYLGNQYVKNEERIPKPIAIVPIPKDWYVIVVTPKNSRGLSENEELRILSTVKEHPEQSTLYRYVLRLVSAALLQDFRTFTDALSNIQYLTGKYFSEYQGGIFRSGITSEIIDVLKSSGIKGIGQSSWGPTAYGFTNSYIKALEVKERILRYLSRKGIDAYVWVTNISSIGHEVRVKLQVREFL